MVMVKLDRDPIMLQSRQTACDLAVTRLCRIATSLVNSNSALDAAAYSFVGQPYTSTDETVEGGGKHRS